MTKQLIFLFLGLVVSNIFFAQSSDIFTQDEITRIKFSVHLITYDTIAAFDNADGEAYYNIVISSFQENLSIPQLAFSTLTSHDKAKIERIIQQLNELKQNPPSWNDLFDRQTQYLIWLDKVSRRHSKYKTVIEQ